MMLLVKNYQIKKIICDIVGKCCESGDIIALDVEVPNVKQGDILVTYTTGAYGYSMSSNYNWSFKTGC